jgi:hypothetical protein
VEDVRRDHAETGTNAPQRTFAERFIVGVRVTVGIRSFIKATVCHRFAGAIAERGPVAFDAPGKVAGLKLTAALAATGDPIIVETLDDRAGIILVAVNRLIAVDAAGGVFSAITDMAADIAPRPCRDDYRRRCLEGQIGRTCKPGQTDQSNGGNNRSA